MTSPRPSSDFSKLLKKGILTIPDDKTAQELVASDFLRENYSSIHTITHVDGPHEPLFSYVNRIQNTRGVTIQFKLNKFLDLTSKGPQTTDLIKKDWKLGICLGYAVCYAVMRRTDKLEWWKDALQAVLDWDETEVSLEKTILLRQSDNNEPISLKKMFERIRDYLYFSQGKWQAMDAKKDVQQLSLAFLQFFYQNKVQSVKKIWKVSGNFSSSQFAELLQERHTVESIYLIFAKTSQDTAHVMYVDYDHEKNQWLLYDSNMFHLKEKPDYLTYSTKEALIERIYQNFVTNTYCISLVKIFGPEEQHEEKMEEPFSVVDQWIRENPIAFFQESFRAIVSFTPEIAKKILMRLCELNTQAGYSQITKELTENGGKAWGSIIWNAPDLFSLTLECVSQIPGGTRMIADQFAKVNKDQQTVWLELAWLDSGNFLIALSYIESLPHLGDYIAQTFSRKNDHEQNTWTCLIARNPSYLITVLELVAQAQNGLKVMEEVLNQQVEGLTGWRHLEKYAPQLLPDVRSLLQEQAEIERIPQPRYFFRPTKRKDLASDRGLVGEPVKNKQKLR